MNRKLPPCAPSRAIPIAILLSLALSAVFSGPARADALDDYIRSEMERWHTPAITFGVFKDGKILRSGSYGLANVELGAPAALDTVFEIGSITKPFTATMVMMLVEESRLSPDDRIDKHLENLPETWRGVTVRQLLNHTSGIPDIEEIFGYDSYRNIYTYDQILAVANSRKVSFPAGTGSSYSNTGYVLLGHILQKIEGQSYGEILQRRICGPLGMTRTRQSDPSTVIPGRSAGYQWIDGTLRNRDAMQPTACLAAGTIVSTVEDMAKWDEAITHHRLLKPETQKLMWEPTRLPDGEIKKYGFGWSISDWKGHPCVDHAGGTAGFSTLYCRIQDLGLSVVVLSNLYAGSGTGIGNIQSRAADSVHPGLSYVSWQPIEEEPKVRDMFLGAMAEVVEGGPPSPRFTEKMWKAYPDQSRKDWKERLAGMKSLQLLDHTRLPAAGGADEHSLDAPVDKYVYRLETGNQVLFIVFTLTADGRIVTQTRVEN